VGPFGGEWPAVDESDAIELVGYHDLADRPGFKMAIQRRDDRWYLYLGSFWASGWSIVDVTDPTAPELVRFVEGPAGARTGQIQVAGGVMATPVERPSGDGVGVDPSAFGIMLWDVASDPTEPRLLGRYASGGSGMHRSFHDGGKLLYATLRDPDGFRRSILVVLDVSDPAAPTEIGRWWYPGQHVAGGEVPLPGKVRLHGPAYVFGDRAYAGWGRGGALILDVADPRRPRLVSRVDFGDFANTSGVHSVIPVDGRSLLVANTEATQEGIAAAPNPTVVIDVADETEPRIISTMPIPRPSPDLPFRNYHEKGGRFGPHNQHHYQGHPDHYRLDDLVALTMFNAGLRMYDIADPYLPVEVGSFVPEAPRRRFGPRPKTALVCSLEDVLIDARGNIFCTDANQGLFVLRHPGIG
jgi:hypothetical protein